MALMYAKNKQEIMNHNDDDGEDANFLTYIIHRKGER